MFNTITITTKDMPEFGKIIDLYCLTDYRTETTTITAKKFNNVDNVNSDMHKFETAAIFDFCNFEREICT